MNMRPVQFVASVLFAVVLAPWSARDAAAMDIQRVRTAAGVEIWYVREPSLPIIAANIVFQEAGAATVPAEKMGLGYFVQVLLDEGAGDLNSLQFQRRLDELSVDLNFDVGTDTFGATLRTLTARRDEAFTLLGLALSKPRFDEEPIQRMRASVLTDLTRRLEAPDDIINRAFTQRLFPGHGYGRSVRGTPEILETLTRADLVDFVQTRFTRDRLVVGAVGDVTVEEIARLVDLAVGGLPATGPKLVVPEVRPTITEEVQVIRRQQMAQSTVLIASYGIKREDPDYYAAAILNAVLGGTSFMSRLWDELREERGLVYSVNTANAVLEHTAYFYGYAATNNERVAESIDLMRLEIDRVLREGITQAELDAARTYLVGSFALSLDTNARIARTLVSIQVAELGPDYINQRAALYGAVTLDDIRRVARRMFLGDANAPLAPAKLSTTIIGDPVRVGKDG
jgi:zinc protease